MLIWIGDNWFFFYWPSPVILETAALQLGTDRGFMDRLVGWCEVEEHAGVQGKEGGPDCLWQTVRSNLK